MKTQNIYELIHSLPIDGTAQCIDALTVTATGLEGKLSIATILHNMADVLAIEPQKPFRFNGASGWARGSVRYADKKNEALGTIWSILMVTGPNSEEALRLALKVGDLKFTRIDIAVDIKMSERILGLARKLKDGYKGKKEVKLIESLTGDTFYCGSRESDVMVRIYDKSSEYGYELGRVWRFEVEYKGARAESVANYVAMQGSNGIPDLLWTSLKSSDLPSPVWGQTVDIKSQKVTMTSSERKLAWLGTQVKPTVKWLMSLGKTEEIIDQLTLPIVGEYIIK